MIDQDDLNEAARMAKQLVIDGSDVDAAVAKASKDWEVPAAAVAVRAEKMFFGPLSQFVGTVVEKTDRLQEALEACARRFMEPDLIMARKQFGAVVLVPEIGRCRYVAWDGRKHWVVAEDSHKVWLTTHRIWKQVDAAMQREAA